MKYIKLFENYNLSGISIEDKLRYVCLIYGSSYYSKFNKNLVEHYRDYTLLIPDVEYLYEKYTGMNVLGILDIHTGEIDKEDIDSIDEWCEYLMNLFKQTYGIDYRIFEDEFILITDYTDIPLTYSGIVYEIDKKEIKIELPDVEDPNTPIKKRTWRILEDRDYLSDFADRIGLKWSCSLYTATFTKK